MTVYLTVNDALTIVKRFGLGPVREMGLLGSAIARPMTTVHGEDAYPDLWTKAAALMHSLIRNHSLLDGNKRLGWIGTKTFLGLNGVHVVGGDDAERLVVTIADVDIEVAEIAAALERLATAS